MTIESRSNMDLMFLKKPISIFEPIGGIMITGNDTRFDTTLAQLRKKAVEQLHRPFARRAAIINITCDQQSIDLLGVDQIEHAIEHRLLFFLHRISVDLFS